jgi:hypothetical protein
VGVLQQRSLLLLMTLPLELQERRLLFGFSMLTIQLELLLMLLHRKLASLAPLLLRLPSLLLLSTLALQTKCSRWRSSRSR